MAVIYFSRVILSKDSIRNLEIALGASCTTYVATLVNDSKGLVGKEKAQVQIFPDKVLMNFGANSKRNIGFAYSLNSPMIEVKKL